MESCDRPESKNEMYQVIEIDVFFEGQELVSNLLRLLHASLALSPLALQLHLLIPKTTLALSASNTYAPCFKQTRLAHFLYVGTQSYK